jgi:hypothetical protein
MAGWKVASATRKLIFKDKGLLAYPIISAFLILIDAGVAFAVWLFVQFLTAGAGLALANAQHTTTVTLWGELLIPTSILVFVLFAVLADFTSVLFLLAMLLSFREFSMKGQKMGMSQALSQAMQYKNVIIKWSIFWTFVILPIEIIEGVISGKKKSHLVSRLVFRFLVNTTLAIALMFVFPIMLDDKVGPIEAMKRSVSTFVGRFGNTVGGLIYTDLYPLLLMLLGLVVIVAAILYVPAPFNVALASVGIIIWGFALVLKDCTMNAFKLILYDAKEGRPLPEGFSQDMIAGAFKQQQQPPSSPGSI